MVSPEIDVLSVFITPWTKPTPSQRATRSACASITRSSSASASLPLPAASRVVARERVGGERDQRLAVVARGEELERADADVARRHAREHRAGQHLLAHDAARPSSRRRARASSGCRAPPSPRSRCTRAARGRARRARRRRARTACGPQPLSWMSRRWPSLPTTSPSRIARPSPSWGTKPPNWWPA